MSIIHDILKQGVEKIMKAHLERYVEIVIDDFKTGLDEESAHWFITSFNNPPRNPLE